jgi:hypothetical protein
MQEDDMIFQGRQIKWQGKKLGYLIKGEKGLIYISPRKSEHYFRIYSGWGINELLLKDLIDKMVVEIRILVDKKKVLITTPQNWLRRGIPHRSKGFEPQIILPEKSFDKVIE